MKKRILVLGLVICILLCACGKKQDKKEKISTEKLGNICELATVECYYHNVAKGDKSSPNGISHWFEKKRNFWVEYDVTIKIGIDCNRIEQHFDEDGVLVITIPRAEILGEPELQPLDKNTMYFDKNSLNPNDISATDQQEYIKISLEEMTENIEEETECFVEAEDRAKELISNYINCINDGLENPIEYKVVVEGRDRDASVSQNEVE